MIVAKQGLDEVRPFAKLMTYNSDRSIVVVAGLFLLLFPGLFIVSCYLVFLCEDI
jgi:hypothetical protein